MTTKKDRPNVGSEVIFELMYFDSNTYFISKKELINRGQFYLLLLFIQNISPILIG